jgi:hypothetical protein
MVFGAWLKVVSLAPDSFWLAFIGQALVGTAQVFIVGVPAQLAAVWFGPSQVSTACALGVIGNQVTHTQPSREILADIPSLSEESWEISSATYASSISPVTVNFSDHSQSCRAFVALQLFRTVSVLVRLLRYCL